MDTTRPSHPRPAPRPPAASRPRPAARAGRLRGDKGYAIALSAMLLVPLTVFTAFATDVGQWYAQATRMQRAADAAALASVIWRDDLITPLHFETAARDVAEANGFKHLALLNTTKDSERVKVTAKKVDPSGVEVCIEANALVFFGKMVKSTERLTRCATAQYNLKVPLGSPRNYLGTGDFGLGAANTPYEPENLWMAISGYCTDREQGDRVASAFWNGTGGATSDPLNDCTGTPNPEYKTDQGNYQYYIDLPANRPYDTDVMIYDGNLRVYSLDKTSPRYCKGDPNAVPPILTPDPVYDTCPGSGRSLFDLMSTNFRIMEPDATVLDDSNNPQIGTPGSRSSCTGGAGPTGMHTFAPTTGGADSNALSPTPPFAPFTFRFGWYNLCRIPRTAPAGRYILQVRNQSHPAGDLADALEPTLGSNGFSIVANRVQTPGLCDSRIEPTCPKVYAKDYLSVYARRTNVEAQFFLADVGRQHQGKTVHIELWDFAENATKFQLLKPTNPDGDTCANNNFTYGVQTFKWRLNTKTSVGPWSSDGQTEIAVPNQDFNGKTIEIEFTLPTNWRPALCNQWFKIKGNWAPPAPGQPGQDRTTWTLKILGDPVHLVG